MRCRRIYKGNVVWFGSYGKNNDDTARFFAAGNKHDNYSDNQEAVADSLTQRLSVIQKELWYATSYGLPLFEKTRSKATVDATVADIIMQHPDVVSILSFSSEVVNHKYSCSVSIQSTFGVVDVNL